MSVSLRNLSHFSFEKFLENVIFFGVAGILLLRPLFSGIVYPATNIRCLIFVIVLFFVLLLKKVISSGFTIRVSTFLVCNLLFIIWSTMSAFQSINPYESVLFLMNYCCYVLFYWILINSELPSKTMTKILFIMIIAGILVSFFGIHQFLFGLKEVREWARLYMNMDRLPESFVFRLHSERIFSTFVYPNALGGYLVLMIPLIVGYYLSLFGGDKKRQKMIFLLVFIAMSLSSIILVEASMIGIAALFFLIFPLLPCIALMLSVSKGSIIVLFLSLFLGLNVFVSKKRLRLVITIALIVIIVILCILFSFSRTKPLTDLLSDTFWVRMEYWIASVDIISEWPMWGTGPGTFGSIYGKYKLPQAEETKMAHNNFIQVITETGVVGGIIMILMWLLLIIDTGRFLSKNNIEKRTRIVAIGLWLGLVGFFLHSFLDFDLYVPGISLTAWSMAGLLHFFTKGYKEIRLKHLYKMQKIVLILALWIVSAVGIMACRNVLYSMEMREIAKKHIQEKEMKASIQLLRKAVASMPLDYKSYFYLGMSYYEQHNKSEALKAAKRAVDLNPNSAMTHHFLAKVYLSDDVTPFDSDNALYHLRKAVESFPTNEFYHLELAAFFEQSQLYGDAIDEYNMAVQYGGNEKRIIEKIKSLKRKMRIN